MLSSRGSSQPKDQTHDERTAMWLYIREIVLEFDRALLVECRDSSSRNGGR